MRLRNFRYFLVVAEEKSFTRAATRVHIEPSPLSRAIKELEAHFGVQLLNRSKGRIRLTWAGEVFRDEAQRILAFLDSAQTRVKSASQGYRGQLRIGLSDNLAQPNLTKLLALSREEEPQTEVRIAEMTTREMLQAIRLDQIDAGFTIDAEAMNDSLKTVVWMERPVIVVPARHPLLALERVPLREAQRYPLILYHPERCAAGHKVISQWLHSSPCPALTVAEYVSGHEPMLMLVAAGYGIGIGLASQTAIYNHPEVVVRPVHDENLQVSTFIAVSDDRPISPELERFIKRACQIGETGIHTYSG